MNVESFPPKPKELLSTCLSFIPVIDFFHRLEMQFIDLFLEIQVGKDHLILDGEDGNHSLDGCGSAQAYVR